MEYTNGTVLRNMATTLGSVRAASARSGGRALKQERFPELRSSDVIVVRARGSLRLLTKLRVHHGLLVANMQVEGHHEGVLHAACGR